MPKQELREKFNYENEIFRKNDFDELREYVPTIATDFGNEGIRIDCYDNTLKLENLSFEKSLRINVKRSIEIEISRCIFYGNLSIYIDSSDVISGINIYIYKTKIYGSLNDGRVASYSRFSIDSSIIDDVSFGDNKFGMIFIFNSEILKLWLEGSNVNKFSLTHCFVNRLSHYRAKFLDVDIDAQSFLGYKKCFSDISPKDFWFESVSQTKAKIAKLKEKYRNGQPFENQSKNEYRAIIKQNIGVYKKSIPKTKSYAREYFFSFVELLKTSINESIDTQVIADLNYNYYRHKRYNPVVFIMMWLLGFFYRPSRVVFSSIGIIFLFGIAYYAIGHAEYRLLTLEELPNLSTLKQVIAELVDSIYFSGITFYTIGYSDLMANITDYYLKILKSLLVLLEGTLGIIFMSSFVVSLVNRFRIK